MFQVFITTDKAAIAERGDYYAMRIVINGGFAAFLLGVQVRIQRYFNRLRDLVVDVDRQFLRIKSSSMCFRCPVSPFLEFD